MNLQKIGAYIAQKRKALGMTQTELAEKLGMSNKSVSKWERGVCLPDVSLYAELCQTLGITINEFIAGEDLPEARFVEQSDENIIQVTKDGKQRGRKLKLVAIVLGVALAVLSAVMLTLHMPRQNYVEPLPSYSTEMMAATLVTGNGDAHIYRYSADRSYYYLSVYLMKYKNGEIVEHSCLMGQRLDEETREGMFAVVTDFDRHFGKVTIYQEGIPISTDFEILEGVKEKELYSRAYSTNQERKRIAKNQEQGLMCLVYDNDNSSIVLSAEEILQGNVPVENDYMYCFTVKFE